MRNDPEAASEVLIGPRWLEEHLADPSLRVVEVDVSSTAYDEGHIAGAVLWNIYTDLKDSGFRLVERTAVEHLLARSGISAATTVVFYGYAPAMGLWLLKLYGHPDARILDTGGTSWQRDGRPWSTEPTVPAPAHYRLPEQDWRLRASRENVEGAIADPAVTILDVRTGAEFRGERFWPSGAAEPDGRAGHIPSARHVPVDGVRRADGSFLGSAEVRRHFAALGDSGGTVIPYCTIGARACTAWFALTYLAGRGDVRVYDGSWAEWGRRAGSPVDAG
ncbi:MAG: sulfurtransferase [Actinomycetales bacterium]